MTETLIKPTDLLTVSDVAKYLGVSRQTVHRYRKQPSNPLPSFKIVGKRKFRMDQLLWWIEKQQTGG